jgi:hypothetical protein
LVIFGGHKLFRSVVLSVLKVAKLQNHPITQFLWSFELKTFDRFPKCIGVVRDGCIALLVPGTDGLQILGTPGWHMGEAIGVLIEKDGRQVFQNKQEIVEATPERLNLLRRFREDLKALIAR